MTFCQMTQKAMAYRSLDCLYFRELAEGTGCKDYHDFADARAVSAVYCHDTGLAGGGPETLRVIPARDPILHIWSEDYRWDCNLASLHRKYAGRINGRAGLHKLEAEQARMADSFAAYAAYQHGGRSWPKGA